MMQIWIVGLLVGLAAVYCIWYLLPLAARKRLGPIHRLLEKTSACGSCSDCGKCASPTPAAGVAPAPQQDQGQPITFYRKP